MSINPKTEISLATRCQWTRGNLTVRSTWQTATKNHCSENIEFRDYYQHRDRLSLYCTNTIMKS